ncbi:hypothetical protein QQ045_007582 [Rhodiola kirilowii]
MIGMLFCVTRDRRLGLVVLRTWKSRRGHPTIPKEVDGFIDKVLVHGEPWGAGNKVEVTATYVFVCAQLLMLVVIRDAMSVARSVGQTERRNWNKVSSIREDPFGKVTGHWYGYVTPDDVPVLMDSHIRKGEIIEKLWRGQNQMGVTEGGKGDKKKHGKQSSPNQKLFIYHILNDYTRLGHMYSTLP